MHWIPQRLQNYSPCFDAATGSSYTGPIDIAGAATGWWGLRAASAAKAAALVNLIQINDQADSNTLDVACLADGSLNEAAITTWVAAHTVTTIKVAKVYDQSGGGNDLVANIGFPTLTQNFIGGKSAITFSGGQALISSSNYTINQPFTMSAVAQTTTGASQGGMISTADASTVALKFRGTPANIGLDAGTAFFSGTEANSNFHAAQGLVNGASSRLYVTASDDTTADAGSGTFSNVQLRFGGGGSILLVGYILEGGIWNSDTSSNFANMKSNQQTYWGF